MASIAITPLTATIYQRVITCNHPKVILKIFPAGGAGWCWMIIQIPSELVAEVSLCRLGGGRGRTLHQHAAEGLVDGRGERGFTVAGRSMASRRLWHLDMESSGGDFGIDDLRAHHEIFVGFDGDFRGFHGLFMGIWLEFHWGFYGDFIMTSWQFI